MLSVSAVLLIVLGPRFCCVGVMKICLTSYYFRGSCQMGRDCETGGGHTHSVDVILWGEK